MYRTIYIYMYRTIYIYMYRTIYIYMYTNKLIERTLHEGDLCL